MKQRTFARSASIPVSRASEGEVQEQQRRSDGAGEHALLATSVRREQLSSVAVSAKSIASPGTSSPSRVCGTHALGSWIMRRPTNNGRYRRSSCREYSMGKPVQRTVRGTGRSRSSATYRRTRALRGSRRIDVTLTPQATAALGVLQKAGLTVSQIVAEALIALAKSRGA